MPRPDIIYRTLVLIRSVTDVRRRLKHLEEETGIPDRQWKHVWALKQRPTAHMLEALARRWPEYGFWLVTGLTDAANGHVSPTVRAEIRSSNSLLGTAVSEALNYFERALLYQEVVADNEPQISPDDFKDEPVDSLTRLILGDAAVVPAGQDEELWEKYLALLNKQQEETKALDQAIAAIAQGRRNQALAERIGVDLSSSAAWKEALEAYSAASKRRNSKLDNEPGTDLSKLSL